MQLTPIVQRLCHGLGGGADADTNLGDNREIVAALALK